MAEQKVLQKAAVPPLEAMGQRLSRNVERWMPDPFLFAIALVAIIFILGMIIERQNPYEMVQFMYKGFWGFLAFAMQMCIILAAGYAIAINPRVQRVISWLCGLPRNGKEATALIALVALALAWVNWGLGLVIGAYMAREMGRQAYFRQIPMHYPLLAVAGYSGLGLTWHWGLSASAPLLSTVEGHFLEGLIGVVPVYLTIFSGYALLNTLFVIVVAIVVLYMLHPAPARSRGIEQYAPHLIEPQEEAKAEKPKAITFADKVENSPWIALFMVLMMLGSIVWWFATKGFMAGLGLNSINFIFILVGLALYMNSIEYVRAIGKAAAVVGGIILLFPFYAGIQGMMIHSGLAVTFAQWLAGIATPLTWPVICWFIAGVINLFVPSGGGQWMAIGETLSLTSIALDVPVGQTIIAFAGGDAWTNLFQPFWAIALLAITGLRARDIFGYCIALLIFAVVPFTLGLTFIPY